MRRYTRNRIARFVGKLAFWTGLIVAVPTTVSLFKPIGWQHRLHWWRFCDGCFDTRSWPGPVFKWMSDQSRSYDWWYDLPDTRCYGFGWPKYYSYYSSDWKIPLGPYVLILTIGGAILLYRVPYRPRGHCQKCNYDLQGNESGICPECGEPTIESFPHTRPWSCNDSIGMN